MNTLLLMLLCSLWTLLIFDWVPLFRTIKNNMGLGDERKLTSDFALVDFSIYIVWKIISCSSCFSAHLFWIVYLIMTGSFIGILLCPIVYFLTFIIREKILTIKL